MLMTARRNGGLVQVIIYVEHSSESSTPDETSLYGGHQMAAIRAENCSISHIYGPGETRLLPVPEMGRQHQRSSHRYMISCVSRMNTPLDLRPKESESTLLTKELLKLELLL